ncbi:glycerol-3-phosphate acyltransferase [Actinocorallia sp. B10E7]|uniref:glycerol-3-phosphate acyltransferase n=1 Tax=Actinocorallia sp. B10E7 TaxID=3153558 RepID=UPI00325CC298
MVLLFAVVIGGYLLGSVPVAVLVARVHGFDPRQVGDRNPGFWNMKEQLGPRASAPVFAGDVLKGLCAGLLGRFCAAWTPGAGTSSGLWTAPDTALVYAAVGAAMVGHAWPVFAGFRGGRSILTFVGGFAVICPPAFLLGLVVLAVTTAAARSFAVGARAAVFGAPVLQLLFAPAKQVAATGLLMCLIGLRFGQAALAARRR